MHVPRTHRSTLLKLSSSAVCLRSTQAVVQTRSEKTRKLPHPIHPSMPACDSSLTALLVVLCCTRCMVYSTAMRIPSPQTPSHNPLLLPLHPMSRRQPASPFAAAPAVASAPRIPWLGNCAAAGWVEVGVHCKSGTRDSPFFLLLAGSGPGTRAVCRIVGF